jgi:hypothetical protein
LIILLVGVIMDNSILVILAIIAGLLILLAIYWISKERGRSSTQIDEPESEGHWIGIGIGIGIAIFMPIGIVFGILIDNIALGISLGPSLGVGAGVAIGAGLAQKHKKDNAFITTEHQTSVKRAVLLGSILVALGVVLLVTLILYR